MDFNTVYKGYEAKGVVDGIGHDLAGWKMILYKDGKKVASIGGVRANGTPYKDYPTYLKELGKEGAEKKRKAYLARHAKEPKSKDGEKTPSYYADVILW